MKTKRCFDCKETKSLNKFYRNIGTKDGYNDRCIDCSKIYGKTRPHYSRTEVVQPGEIAAIDKLKSLGIYAAPGKCSEFKWVDVVAWGCVRIEVKYTSSSDGNVISWHLGHKDHSRWEDIDLVLFINDKNGVKDYYLIYADNPIFYKESGEAKTGIAIRMNPKYTRNNVRDVVLENQDNWSLIEEIRQNKITSLIDSVVF